MSSGRAKREGDEVDPHKRVMVYQKQKPTFTARQKRRVLKKTRRDIKAASK